MGHQDKRNPSVKDRYITHLEDEIARLNLEINEFKITCQKMVDQLRGLNKKDDMEGT